MQKASEVLIILSPEEKRAAQEFVVQRIRTFDSAQLSKIQELAKLSTHQVRRLQIDRQRYRGSSIKATRITMKLYEVAMSGLTFLISECNQCLKSNARKIKNADGAPGEPGDAKSNEGLILTTTQDEEDRALEYIQKKVEGLRVPDLRVFRDACLYLLTWWESDRGQSEGLLLGQHGDVNSAAGRMAIREMRENLSHHIFQPFKAFYSAVNLHHQKMSKEMTNRSKQDAPDAGPQ